MELDRRLQLEQLEQISRQNKRLSASARSMARHRIKAAKLESEAARTTAADEFTSAAAGGDSFGARDLKDLHVNRLVRSRRPQSQDLRGG